jgi:hypothetical protein
MLLRCTAKLPTLPQSVRLGRYFKPGAQEFPVEIGREYLAFGLRLWGAGVWVDIEVDAGYLVSVPLGLFEVVDAKVSETWTIRLHDDGDVALMPEPFHAEFFHDDLIEGVAAARIAFNEVKRQLLAEQRSA